VLGLVFCFIILVRPFRGVFLTEFFDLFGNYILKLVLNKSIKLLLEHSGVYF